MASPAVAAELLRQQVIVQLLRESPRSAQETRSILETCFRRHVLTPAVCDEVRTLLAEKEGRSDAAPAAAAHLEASRFEREFERLELLGKGAFGEVWRVRHRVDRKEYAVKMVPYEFRQDKGPLDHPALREAQTWASFDVPGTVRYHTSWVEVSDGGSSHGTSPEGSAPATPRAEETRACFEADATASTWSYDSGLGGTRANVVFEDDSASSDCGSEPACKPALQVAPAPTTRSSAPQLRRATLFLQTELVRGGTLREWIDQRNVAYAAAGGSTAGLPAEYSRARTERIFRQCVDAVARLHEQGLVHRDIKPGNILLTEDGNVRLADFGLATKDPGSVRAAPMVEDAERPGAPAEHTRGVGTPSYASPEQMAGTHYGNKVDIFALGVVAAELVLPVRTQMERAKLFESLRQGRLPAGADLLCAEAEAVHLLLAMVNPDPHERPSAEQLSVFLHRRSCDQKLQQLWRAEGAARGHIVVAAVGGPTAAGALPAPATDANEDDGRACPELDWVKEASVAIA